MFYFVQLSFRLADEPFVKALRIFETCVSVNNNLWGKLFSSLESRTTFDESFKVTLVPFFISYFLFYSLSCELDNFTFKELYWVILYWYYTKTKKNYSTFTVLYEKSKMVSFTSSIMKNIVVLSSTSSPRSNFL